MFLPYKHPFSLVLMLEEKLVSTDLPKVLNEQTKAKLVIGIENIKSYLTSYPIKDLNQFYATLYKSMRSKFVKEVRL